MECGWVVTEVGRQPWVVYRLQTTAAAATTNGGVITSLSMIIVLYAVLGAATILILRMLARRWRRGDAREAAVPYGPPRAAGPGRGPGRAVMAAAAVGAILLASVTLYAVLGGADFGGGLWDLLAGGDRRGRAPRALIDESITPVWEANHVWLVFALVIFWTAFPHAFAAVMTTAALPLWLAVAGIVLRGAGFAFRKEAVPAAPAARGRRDLRLLLAADPVLHGHRDRRHRNRRDTRQCRPRQPVRLDQPDVAADRVPVRRRLRLPRRRLPGRRGRPPRRPAHAGLLHPPRPGRRHRGRGAVAGHPGRTAQLEPGTVQPPHRPGAAAGDHRRAVRPGRPGPAHRSPARAASGSSPRSAWPPSSGDGAWPSTRCCCPAPR